MQTRNNSEKVSFFCIPSKGLVIKGLCEMEQIIKQTKKIAEDDPRRLIHSLKVGISITLVSLFYYFQPLYVNLGVSAMWAVMTVVVVSEFSVGATLGKGLNRIFATLVAGALGLGAHHLSTVFGKTYEPILIGFFVFLQAAASTFIRFFPKVKARYDYGMLIFILTFCMVSISGLRTDQVIDVAQKRLLMVLLGASTCVLVSILVCPVWAGEDLHKLVSLNLLDLGVFLQDECLRTLEGSGRSSSSLNGLNSVLDSKSSIETLANFAVWEPRHGRFMYRHPWKQYLKISCLTRQCAARVEALNGHLINTQIQFNIFEAPQEIKDMISSMSSEAGKALKDLGNAIETMTRPTSVNLHLSNLKIRAKGFNSLINSDFWDDQVTNILQVMPIVAVASLLDETVLSVESIAVAVDELSSMAKFKCNQQGTIEEKIDHDEGDGSIKLNNNNNNNKHVSIEIIDGGDQVKQEGKKTNELC